MSSRPRTRPRSRACTNSGCRNAHRTCVRLCLCPRPGLGVNCGAWGSVNAPTGQDEGRTIMRKAAFSLAIIALALPLLAASPAQAQAARTWVSGTGDDANPCSRTAPCKTFAGAISKTAAGGEISVLDPGGFGAVTITKSITINGDGTLAGLLASLTNGIIIN